MHKLFCFDESTPPKSFSNFLESALKARRQGKENPNSTVVAETMKLLANNSYSYQIIDRNLPSVTKYMNDEKTDAPINKKKFKILMPVSDQFYEVEFVKTEIEHKKSIIVGFFHPALR